MKFTKKEINLCKEIAKRYKKYFKYGNWYEYKNDSFLITSQPQSEMSPEITILWTIFDCLGFLKKEINSFKLKFARGKFKFHYRKNWWIKSICYYGKTPLEACLKAVLSVLEEK